ncbi:39S ribosomal protein L37, mitochondrial [Bradysia coprophila]|uniref:39S ribosomal protein L37, mitochondrial n=1 Tax=Bradysia coprophila TaxID=38358 RepID=UPI00187DA9A0|nr:39S ribosomal protein L37, mitochondrial [Bradysia coprophila]
MRITSALFRQHGDFMFKKHWLVAGQGIPTVQDTGAVTAAESHGLPVVDAVEYMNRKPRAERFVIERSSLNPPGEVFDRTHPLWNERKWFTFCDQNVLVEGMSQAQVLTKSIVVDGLPSSVEQAIDSIKIPGRSDAFMQDMVRFSFLFEAEQQKLPKRRDPDRPAHIFKRDYGITSFRRNRVLIDKTIQECEKLAGRSVVSDRKVESDVLFALPIETDGGFLQMEITADAFVTSKKPIAPVSADRTEFSDSQLPDLFPLAPTVGMDTMDTTSTPVLGPLLTEEKFYVKNRIVKEMQPINNCQIRDSYPVPRTSPYYHPHTIFLRFTKEDVRNLSELPITESQFQSRSMLKAFAVAASSARSLYGVNVTDLEKPIVVQTIQFNDKSIQFGLFQLNTLNLNGVNGTKNVWFHGPTLELFSECRYRISRPELTGYNPDVLRYIYGFYKTN